MKRSIRKWLVAGALSTIAGFGGYLLIERYLDTYHLETVQEGVLYRDGLQSTWEFETAIKKVKPKTVVALIDEYELKDPNKPQFKKGEEICRRHGVQVVRIPVKLGGWPTEQDVDRFLDIARDPRNQPVLVHCAQGVRRTGMMIAAYQESVLGYDNQKAKSKLVAFGHSNRTVNDVKRFIDGYDPKTGDVPELPPSKE